MRENRGNKSSYKVMREERRVREKERGGGNVAQREKELRERGAGQGECGRQRG